MKKEVMLFGVLFLLIALPFMIAEENKTEGDISIADENSEDAKITKAYNCLAEKVKDDCSSSLEDNIFTLLAIKKCKSEVKDAIASSNCWPSSGCTIKTTAQAVLALHEYGVDTNESEDWLLSQKAIPTELTWYLQIESPESTSCSITYAGSTYQTFISEDKKITSSAGSCLSVSENSYWLRVSPACYQNEFKITCNKRFLTSLLFKKQSSSTIHILERTSEAGAEGTTKEKVNSACFAKGGVCTYEGSLWAAMVLDYLKVDVSEYLPYLITMAGEKEEYIPESFLYTLTGDDNFRQTLLQKQKSSSYWDESGDKFYDTSVALFPFKYEDPSEKLNAKTWLLGIQSDDGCWRTSTKNNAFVLYSLWPRSSYEPKGPSSSNVDCIDAGYSCLSRADCEDSGGNELTQYVGCTSPNICCSEELKEETCTEKGGTICNSLQTCESGTTLYAGDLESGETCCIDGICTTTTSIGSDCELFGGTCKTFSCDDGYESTTEYTCEYSGDTCCMPKEKKSYWWIYLLIFLIMLVVLAIIFREKLKPFWFRIKSKFRKSKPGRPGPRTPPSSAIPFRRPMSRTIIPLSKDIPKFRPEPVKKPSPELDDVLKKLKDMSK